MSSWYPPAPTDGNTWLVLSSMGVPLYSARGLSQTLEPIDGSKSIRRSINGILTDVSHDQFRKYKSKISCTDQRSPAFDGIWPGMTVVVDCIAYLSYPTTGSPQRTVVAGSAYTEGSFTFYRPQLTMMVMANSAQTDEWDANVPWELELEEI